MSCILRNRTAIELSVRFVRIFVEMRRRAFANKEICPKLLKLERKLAGNNRNIRNIFILLRELGSDSPGML
jgi:hypothetical protein